MFNNLVYFEKHIKEPNSIGLKTYLNHINNKQIISNPIIFCDKYTFIINNISIFHTLYIKNLFSKQYILVNKYDSHYLIDMGLRSSIIEIYDSTLETKSDKIISYDYCSNSFTKFIESVYYEKI